ncbi:putative adhesin [Planomicrobium soli]|uniref:Putative adhesin n=1 Tax=Planomicrobium soli TaxID=1176648 RepID=A0A2P8H5C9_9BACL|nr:DUF4097 family beta strand repeat-containing protein [Planomicrobium soli]PSL41435.1 putative adhesin [Planomicrobium soli]
MIALKGITLLILSLLLAAIAFGIFRYNPFTLANETSKETIIDEEVRNIEITTENTAILLLPSENASTEIKVTGDRKNFNLNTFVQEKNLVIETENKNPSSSSTTEKLPLLTVYVPQPNIVSLTLININGSIEARDVEAYEIGAETDKGDVDFQNLYMKYIVAKTSNGNIKMKHAEAQLIKAVAMGDIHVENTFGSFTGISSNGNIDVVLDEIMNSMDLNAENGSISVQTKESLLDAKVESEAQNGVIDILGESDANLVYGEGSYLIKLKANNGDILFTNEE